MARDVAKSWPAWPWPARWQARAACLGVDLEVFFVPGTAARVSPIRVQVDGTMKSRSDTPGETSVASSIVTRPPSTWSSTNRRRPSPE
jgi:hypothetical protein